MNQNANKGLVEIESEIPLGEMFGYSTQLRSITSGRGTYVMEPSHFEKAPAKILEEISKK
jgi:elongation factor G